ncbi:hypothetical protein FF38_07727 [Lucilia cuprina]|uniref:Uncharacterized protein n=1 Tax=Lucilia cuprina TaxID=7375 RepID=A0A0L0BL00_LUCCU|nr:hypothetical protein CVS40_2221 [Lucilia cuprina]KNC20722.1 hypothetical protein FF38_07727 [Lucilia cuprina]
MTSKGLILLTVLCYINLSYARPQQQEQTLKSFWNTARPGELLRSLDTITSATQYFTQPVEVKREIKEDQAEKPQKVQLLRKSDEELADNLKDSNSDKVILQRRIGEGSEESLEEKSPYDYDKAYEEFVKKYFDDSVTDALSASDSTENSHNEQHDAEAYSGEEELESSEALEPVIEASRKSSKTEKCKKIVRGQENCLICKNLRNGENSESCSYNKETKPLSYGFEKQKNFRKYRATPKSSEKEELNSNEKIARTDNNNANVTSSCSINKIKNKICYHCETVKGKKTTKCYAEETPIERTRDNKKNVQKSQQRIFKRTLSYSYENTPYTKDIKNNTHILDKPLIQKDFLVKNLNKMER